MQVRCFLQFIPTYILCHMLQRPEKTETTEVDDRWRQNRKRRASGPITPQSPNMTASGQLYVEVADEVSSIEVSAALDHCAVTCFLINCNATHTLPRICLRYAKSEFEHAVCMAPNARQQPQCKHHYSTPSIEWITAQLVANGDITITF